MQSAVQSARPSVVAQRVACAGSRRAVSVRAFQSSEIANDLTKNAAIAAAALSLTLATATDAHASIKKTTVRERELAYQQELFDSIKARTGKTDALPSLTSSPKDKVAGEVKTAPALKFDGGIEKTNVEVPSSVPTPAPALPSIAAPSPPKSFSAPASPTPTSAPSSGDNKNVLAVAAIAIVGAAGLAATNNGGAALEGAGGAPPAAAAASGGDVLPNVRDAREWIAAWKKKHGKA